MTHATLTATLQAIGKPAHTVAMPDGSRVLLLPHGGRVLGLFAGRGEENFYWTNPALASPESAAAFYAGGEWHNSGGDRTWLSPELDLFFPRYPDLDPATYFQPRELDPGCYRLEECGGVACLINRLSVTLHRSKATAELEIRKWVAPAPHPLRYEKDGGRGVEYAGYTQHTALALLRGENARVGLWNLLQMPHRGEMIIPVYVESEPKVYFGEIPGGDLVSTGRTIRWKMHAQGGQKIGVRAAAAAGRVGYRYGNGDRTVLIVRNFRIDPSGEYIDVPWSEPEDLGYAVQACNIDGHWGSFSELEYHVPAIGHDTGATACEDVSQVWVFRGPEASIDSVIARLLCPAG